MKIQLTIELDIPDELKEYTLPELQQWVFDGYVNYVTVSHYKDALTWLASPESITKAEHVNTHKGWAEWAGKAQWSVKEIM